MVLGLTNGDSLVIKMKMKLKKKKSQKEEWRDIIIGQNKMISANKINRFYMIKKKEIIMSLPLRVFWHQ